MNNISKNNNKVMFVSSSGGHLTEILKIVEALELEDPVFLTYTGNPEKILKKAYFVENMGTPSKFYDIFIGLYKIIKILSKEKPKYIISTGSEIAFFVFYIAKIISFLRIKLIYIECSAQVANPSLTGRMVYPICDLFFVQWRPLVKRYGRKARYSGNLIFGEV